MNELYFTMNDGTTKTFVVAFDNWDVNGGYTAFVIQQDDKVTIIPMSAVKCVEVREV